MHIQGVSLSQLSLRFVRLLSRSAGSSVYEVRTRSDERLALKILEHGRMGASASRRFERERRVLASLLHPSIPPVVASGRTGDGRPFLLSPFVRGESLATRIARGPLDVLEASATTLWVLGALDAAHRAGVVHRDVKPRNILLRADGPDVLVDFGIAHVRGADSLTSDSHFVGTPRWLAPEQILGGRVDARTDLYALGFVLWEALAGFHPFVGWSDEDVVGAHLEQRVPALPERVDRRLEGVIARATAKAPGERFPSAAAMAFAIDRALGPVTDLELAP